jgi:adenosine deaminase CECR1
MPKGALLHAHLDATVNAETLMSLAIKQPAMHICVPVRLDEGSLHSTLPVFQPLSAEESNLVSGTSLTDPSYNPNTWVNLADARRNFSLKLGGPEGFDQWVLGALTINPEEAYRTHNTVPKVRLRYLDSVGLPLIR